MCLTAAKEIIQKTQNKTILCAVIDDDCKCCHLICDLLKEFGFVVKRYKSISELSTETTFDIMFLSLCNGNIPSTEKIQEICDVNRNTSFIICVDSNKSVSFDFPLKPTGFLFKPFGIENLIELIYDAIGG
jgi:DNA-binding NtrC family response regulator